MSWSLGALLRTLLGRGRGAETGVSHAGRDELHVRIGERVYWVYAEGRRGDVAYVVDPQVLDVTGGQPITTARAAPPEVAADVLERVRRWSAITGVAVEIASRRS